jgi:hypothetical protein
VVRERELPAVLVNHELADAQAFASQLAVLDEGRLLQRGGPAEVVARPASRRVAELVGYRGFVPVAAASGPGGWVAVAGPADHAGGSGAPAPGGLDSAGGAKPGGKDGRGGAGPGRLVGGGVVAGIHPERVVPGAHPERGVVLTGPVTASRPAGAGWEADLDIAGGEVTCRLPDRPAGPTVTVTAVAPPCFGADGAPLASGVRA